MLQYVLIDPGAPLPHVYAAPQAHNYGLGQEDAEPAVEEPAVTSTPAAPTMTSSQLFDKLYEQNKLAFWVGGGAVGFLALAGLYNLLLGGGR